MARDTITLSFSKQNKDVYNMLQKVDGRIIDYICKLVREDQVPNKNNIPGNIIPEVLRNLEEINRKLDGKVLDKVENKDDVWAIDEDIESMILDEDD